MKKFDQFCYKYERYGIKNLMLIVLCGQALVLLLNLFAEGWYDVISFRPDLILQGQVWRVITFVFIPSRDGIWFIFFFLLYYWFGRALESQWGRMKFTVYYFSGILLTIGYGILVVALYNAALGNPISANMEYSGYFITNEYVNLSVLLAFATLCPDEQIRLYFLIPIKMKWIAVLDFVLMFSQVLLLPFTIWDSTNKMLTVLVAIAPLMAILNYFIFFRFSLLRSFSRRAPRQYKERTVKFKQGVKEAAHKKGYIHKCAVCGLTDADRPDMEFRYCSLCEGYQCYCSEHIFTHQHKRQVGP